MAKAGPRIAVLGAGPIGLEAALLARRLGYATTVYERGRIGEHLERWGHVKLFTPFMQNSTPLGRAVLRVDSLSPISGRDLVREYLAPLAASPLLAECIRAETHVVAIGRAGQLRSDPGPRTGPFRLLIRDAKGQESTVEADIVLDCTGTYGTNRYLGEGGLPAAGELACENQIAYGLEDIAGNRKSYYSGKTVLLVGAGHSAATHASLLADLAQIANETWVVWLARSARSQPLHRVPNDPYRDRDRLAVRANSLATRGEGNIEFHADSVVERIVALGLEKGFQVTARVAGKLRSWEIDRIIASVGHRPDDALARELQTTSDPINTAFTSGEPGYFVLGAKSLGRSSEFTMKQGHEQIHRQFAELTGKSNAALAELR